jgi:hypothetical protein
MLDHSPQPLDGGSRSGGRGGFPRRFHIHCSLTISGVTYIGRMLFAEPVNNTVM